MSTRLVVQMNATIADRPQDVIAALEASSNLVEAAKDVDLDLNDVERDLLAGVPEELFTGLKAALVTALQAEYAVRVDWAEGLVHEIEVSDSGDGEVFVLLRAPSPFETAD